MSVTQALTGSGGWPMTIIMTPDKKPFHAGTYFPKNRRWGRPGLMELLSKIAELWHSERQKINDSADRITRHVTGLSAGRSAPNHDREILDQVQAFLVRAYYDGAIPSGNSVVVIVGNPQSKDTISMLTALRKPFLPEKVVLFRPLDSKAAKDLTAIAPFSRSMVAKNGQATAYVCQAFACKLPTTSIDQMLENLRQN